jgi:Heparinase II/III-like protein/Alginate lyase/Carbohydrate family 9 binding domain-like
VLSAAELQRRREVLDESADLTALARRLEARVAPVIARAPMISPHKALLSSDGGVCPDDGVALVFDPWSPAGHRCSRCGRTYTGERHDRAWARFGHLWLAGRAATLATLASLTGHEPAAVRANEILAGYASTRFDYPNRDNVLGPSRLFFSTYLESIWITDYLAAASLLREAEALDADVAEGVGVVAEDAANLIGEFDEGFSNRQTWHNAALAAIAVWFEDGELLERAVQGPTGMLPHLVEGFGEDGMWYEGENYHLFALRGQLVGMGWARQGGMDLLEDERLAGRLSTALRVPALTALPDHTFPARKDSRFGVSLAQPMYLELWEVGLARLGDGTSDLWSWLRELYASPAPRAETFDSYLHEAGEPAPDHRTRADLSWWSLVEMAPALPDAPAPWSPESVLLERQGLAVLRRGDRYASLECGRLGGGHGHPDRLQLALHEAGVYWLADPGTGSYVAGDLLWYRSTLAHNAPRLDGRSQPPGDAECEAFDVQEHWSWARGRYGEMSRTLVAGSAYLLDVVELGAPEDRTLDLAWHPTGQVEVLTPGAWSRETWHESFLEQPERFAGATDAGVVLRCESATGVVLHLYLAFHGTLHRARVPGRPGDPDRRMMYVVRVTGRAARIVTALALESMGLRGMSFEGELIEVTSAAGIDRHLATASGWEIEGRAPAKLGGTRRPVAGARPLIDFDRREPVSAVATYAPSAPELDGTLDGFDASTPLTLDYDDQYRRSEEPYAGPEEFSATALAAWNEEALYLGVDVVKAEVISRPDDAEPLRLDNDPDDIHVDGLQVYVRAQDGAVYGFLVALAEGGRVRASGTAETAGRADMVSGAWQATGTGYSVTLRLALPEWTPRGGDVLGFDLLVNEIHPERLRRAGQLVWSGGGGWVYLRGDRQSVESFGRLELR